MEGLRGESNPWYGSIALHPLPRPRPLSESNVSEYVLAVFFARQ